MLTPSSLIFHLGMSPRDVLMHIFCNSVSLETGPKYAVVPGGPARLLQETGFRSCSPLILSAAHPTASQMFASVMQSLYPCLTLDARCALIRPTFTGPPRL
jgi:hypothetical protein